MAPTTSGEPRNTPRGMPEPWLAEVAACGPSSFIFEADVLGAALAREIDHVDHLAVRHGLVRVDEHVLVRHRLQAARDLVQHLLLAHQPAVQRDLRLLTLGLGLVDRDDELVGVWWWRHDRNDVGRQLEAHLLDLDRDVDHHDDEHDEHDVDQRRHVDVADRALGSELGAHLLLLARGDEH